MPLSRIANEMAAEIAQHDWSDAPYRIDRAGHQREHDSKAPAEVLDRNETECVRLNVMWVAAQVLGHADSNFDIVEFAAACGVRERRPGILQAGLRRLRDSGVYATPGTFDYGPQAAPQPLAHTPLRAVAAAAPAAPEPNDRLNLRVTLDVDDSLRWGQLRGFVAMADHEDHEAVGLEYDQASQDFRGLYAYVG